MVVIILIAVVILPQALTVGLSLFLRAMPSLLLPGIVAPPYHLNLALSIVIIFIKIEVIHIMLLAVVSRARVLFVGLSLFMPRAMLRLLAGVLAPPYHLNRL